jgi:hypothetical protein
MPDLSSALGSGAGEFGLAGLGLEIYGGLSAMNAAKQETEISKQEVGVELQQDAVRRQAMELSAQRQMTQQVRNNQQARSAALAAQVASGGSGMAGQQSSSFGGAVGNISGATGQNILGISQNLQQGEQMFNLNASLDQLKLQMAGAQGNAATAQGISSLGGSLMSVGKTFGG